MRSSRLLLAWVFAGMLFGCAQNVRMREVVLPTGERGYSISCANSKDINECYELAGDICSYGYEIMNNELQNGYSSSALGLTGSNVFGVTGTATSNSTWQKGLLIKCKRQVELDAMKREERKTETMKSGQTAKVVPFFVVGLLAMLIIVGLTSQ